MQCSRTKKMRKNKACVLGSQLALLGGGGPGTGSGGRVSWRAVQAQAALKAPLPAPSSQLGGGYCLPGGCGRMSLQKRGERLRSLQMVPLVSTTD